jgi:hypothetical protein
MPTTNRRRFERIRLSLPLQGSIGAHQVVVRNLSLIGCGIEHHFPLQVGTRVRLSFPWNGEMVSIESTVVRCKLEGSLVERDLSVYSSGVRFAESSGWQVRVIREMVASQVSRALESQKENARGDIPKYLQKMAIFRDGILTAHPDFDDSYTSLPSMRIARSRGYVRYGLERGTWRKKKTQDPTQPPEGFTVWAYEDSDQLEQLCETYQRGDEDIRSLIRIIAELSLTVDDTIPPQAFQP